MGTLTQQVPIERDLKPPNQKQILQPFWSPLGIEVVSLEVKEET
jgi:hypothetical protein